MAWIGELKASGRKDNTILVYLQSFMLAIGDLSILLARPFQPADVGALTLDLARQWEAMRIAAGDAPATVNARSAALKSYLRFDADQRADAPPAFVRKQNLPVFSGAPTSIPPGLAEEAAHAQAQLKRGDDVPDWVERRNAAMVTLIELGMTPAEVAAIERPEGEIRDWRTLRASDARTAERDVPLSEMAREAIDQYLQFVPYHVRPGQPLFLSKQGTQIRREAIKMAMTRMSESAGLPVLATTRAIRHGLTRQLRDAGAPIEEVASAVGVTPASVAQFVANSEECFGARGRARAGGDPAFVKATRNLDGEAEGFIRRFLAYLALETSLIETTIITYCRIARRYLQFCVDRSQADEIVLQPLAIFLEEKSFRCRGGTEVVARAAITRFLAWLEAQGYTPPARGKRQSSSQPRLEAFSTIPLPMIDRAISLLDNDGGSSVRRAMASVIISLAAQYGLRQQELVDCRFSHISWAPDGTASLAVNSSAIVINRSTAARMKNLISFYGMPPGADFPLLLSPANRNEPISSRYMIQVLQQVPLELGLQPFSSRALRNSFIARTLMMHGDIMKAGAITRISDVSRLLRIRARLKLDAPIKAANDSGSGATIARAS